MNEKKYLIYLDILGFEGLAKEMAEGTPFEEDKIRQDYLSDPLKEKIEGIEREGIQTPKGISEIEGSDNYVLIVDNIQTAFELVGKLTTIKIPHEDYEFIPLEVALGTKKIDEDIEVRPINRKEIIKFLKEDVIKSYRSYYENKNDKKIKETFVLFTQEFFDDLEPLDKKYCERISHRNETFFVADLEKIQQRARVFEFLEKIGRPDNTWYGRIDEVYIPPSEYKNIVEMLKENRILFITGTLESGKTYTAVRLMWEFYNRGYEPRWMNGGSQTKREAVGEKLEDIRSELKPMHIVYFEDPFGENEYKPRKWLEREIGTIIDSVRQVEDGYVIITSREEVFKEFKTKKLSAMDIKEFVVKLDIKKPSYDYEKRKEILIGWAEKEDCKWLRNEELKRLILESIKNETVLPTPLNMKDFVIATFDIEDEDALKEKLKEKSKETAKAFAKEIKNMDDDKILFLSFPFISGYFEIPFVRATYQELVDELHLKDVWGFDRVLDWFKDDKIEIVDEHIRFSHPSYSEALEHLLVETGYPTRINREIFSRLLSCLSEKGNLSTLNVIGVAWTVANHFDKLPNDVRNKLLFKLYEKKDMASGYVAWAVANHLDKLPEDVRNKFLLKLHEKNDAVTGYVASAIGVCVAQLPDDVGRKLLIELSEKDKAAQCVAHAIAIAYNFDKVTITVKNLLDKLQKPLQQVIENLSSSEEQRDQEEALRLISNALPKLNLNFALKILNKLSESDYEKVRTEAAKLLKTISDGLNGDK